MTSHFRFIIYSLLIIILMVSCGTKKTTETAVNDSDSTDISAPSEVVEQVVNELSIGSKAPDFNLKGVDGNMHRLDEYKDSEVLVVVFTCNHCPTAQAYEERIKSVVNDYKEKNVQLVAISPNSEEALLLEELSYSDMADTYEDMVIRARDHSFNFPYLYDGGTQEVSLKYGPVATPHAFVFNSKRELTYRGRLDGSEKPGSANAEDLRNAIDATLKGEEIANPVTKTFGCSIKWSWKSEYKTKVNKEWEESEVTLEEIDAEGIKALFRNPSDKLRMFNFWATWCGPCVLEYPDLLDIHRMYKGRDFEFISVSLDKLSKKDKALKFLTGKHSAIQNYIYSEEDIYKMLEAIDPELEGVIPFTLLVEPGGKIVFKQIGIIEPLKLKRAIVDHPLIGRYY